MLLKLSAVALFMASSAVAFPSFIQSERLAPIFSPLDADIVPDSYFVVFKSGVRASEHSAWIRDLHQRDISINGVWDDFTSGVKHVYDMGSFQGVAGRFRSDVLDEIRKNPDVDYIERDQIVYTSEITTQNRAPWGLARISHRKGLTLGTFNKYEHNPNGGNGVTVFVIDTGINIKHVEFEGRAEWGKTVPSGDPDTDDNGHGTHCAGTIASRAYGVSKKAKVVAVKVLRSNGSGTMSDVVGGVEYAVDSHKALETAQGKKYKGSVANMSLGGGKSRPLDAAVANAIESGLHFAVAAGNDNRDACDYSPAGVPTAVTVGASTLDDTRAYFSNYGRCVDIFGPGLNIESTYIGSATAKRTLSGTSMASPHVAGLIAYYLSLAPESSSSFHSGPLTPQEMKDLLIERGTRDILTDVKSGSPNILIYNNAAEDRGSFYAW
ncbi:serine protease [Entomortierella chlamydospora]|uniref:Serine protease n=1 Tax=Entomortierella chlamydospora TaxID=101097 RepID=A0A9P6MYA8_9FUNG|nr:serine protease [Entomortierella chlamydospora]KAG0016899.1 serine protease [Entomortierella chlamydospora]